MSIRIQSTGDTLFRQSFRVCHDGGYHYDVFPDYCESGEYFVWEQMSESLQAQLEAANVPRIDLCSDGCEPPNVWGEEAVDGEFVRVEDVLRALGQDP